MPIWNAGKEWVVHTGVMRGSANPCAIEAVRYQLASTNGDPRI
ncbi:MAG: hypothetical protein ABI811_09550 [Acidobacteriota bacterium]